MELKDWINIIAIVLSPIVAVLITMWLTTRNEKRKEKEASFLQRSAKACFQMQRPSAVPETKDTVRQRKRKERGWQQDPKAQRSQSPFWGS